MGGKKKVLEPFGGAVLCREKSAELVGRLGAGNKLLCKQLAAYKLSELVAQAGLKPFHKEQQDNPWKICENVRLSPLEIPWGEAYFLRCIFNLSSAALPS